MEGQGNLDSLLGIPPPEETTVSWLTMQAPDRPAKESGFTWPVECPFGGICRLFAIAGVKGCPRGCTYCWMRQTWEKYTRPKLPEGTEYEDPVVLTDLVRRFDAQLRRDSSLAGQWLLLSNTTDPLAEPALEVFPELAGLALLRGMNLVVLSKSAPPFDMAVSPLLERSILKTDRQIWWGATITTVDDDVAKEIEPHSPPPSERLRFLNSVKSWAQVQGIQDRLKTWVSVGGWHAKTNPLALLKALHEVGVELVIVEMLNRKPDCPIEWKDWLVAPREIHLKILGKMIEFGAENGMLMVFKDTLRQRVLGNGKLRKLYESMHGKEKLLEGMK